MTIFITFLKFQIHNTSSGYIYILYPEPRRSIMTMKKPSTNADNWVSRKYGLAVEDPLLEQTRKRAKEQSRWHCKAPTMELLVVAIFSFQALSFLLFCRKLVSTTLSLFWQAHFPLQNVPTYFELHTCRK